LDSSFYYAIRHLTRFRYSASISESVMEVRMHPRSEGIQHCLEFEISTDPAAQILHYRDYHGNIVQHFDIPGRHAQLTITTEAIVQILPPEPVPDALGAGAWEELDTITATDEYWDLLQPGFFVRSGKLLNDWMQEVPIIRGDDPLSTLRMINATISTSFEYVPHSTTVDSPIDDALRTRRGVCQDFAHIMAAVVRSLGIPCRYVSGYLFHRYEDHDRSQDDATHAWVEALLPGLGWVGFDPTNNLVAAERHIRTAVGRDYADVPPTRGVFKGEATSELDVGVRVSPTEAPIPEDEELLPEIVWSPPADEGEAEDQQQQQQQ
jgi:transglutaminase-like putative cysteine protease